MPFQGRRAKRLRRLLSRWNRGQVQSAIRYKALANGIRLAGPRGGGICARGTSSTCPRCGKWDPSARDRSKRRFSCKAEGCAYSDNDDVTGAANIAARGFAYFHRPMGEGERPQRKPRPPSFGDNPPQEPDHASTGGDSQRTSVLSEGAASSPQATTGGAVGSSSQLVKNSENGVGVAVPQGNRPSPTEGASRGISDPTTNPSDETETKDTVGPASAEVVTPPRGGARADVEAPEAEPFEPPLGFAMGTLSKTGGLSPRPTEPAVATSGYRGGEWRPHPESHGATTHHVATSGYRGGEWRYRPIVKQISPGLRRNEWLSGRRMEVKPLATVRRGTPGSQRVAIGRRRGGWGCRGTRSRSGRQRSVDRGPFERTRSSG